MLRIQLFYKLNVNKVLKNRKKRGLFLFVIVKMFTFNLHLQHMVKEPQLGAERSHDAHSRWYEDRYQSEQEKLEVIDKWKYDQDNNTINRWLQLRYLNLINPLLKEKHTWLSIGDPYGFDAYYLNAKNQDATATDIAGTFFPIVKKQGIIEKYAIENAENLSFEDNSFDYVLCKEAYHHFPRPYLAVYEMLRVAKEAVVLIEPQDPIGKMPLLLAICNLIDRVNPMFTRKLWRNRYSFEEVGNYVFKLSMREVDKLANGIALPAVAFKEINNNFYTPAIIREKADSSSRVFTKIKRKLAFYNLLTKSTLLPSDTLCAIIFKKPPSESCILALKKEGYIVHSFPINPYL